MHKGGGFWWWGQWEQERLRSLWIIHSHIHIFPCIHTHVHIPTHFFLLWQGFPLYTSQVAFKAVSKFHPNQNLIFSKHIDLALMQPSAPGYLMCFALSKRRDKRAFKRSSAQQQKGAHGYLHSKATLGTATVSGSLTRELWWDNHTSSGHSTAVEASLRPLLKDCFYLRDAWQALSPSHMVSEQYTTVEATRCNGALCLHFLELQDIPSGGGSCQGEVLPLIHHMSAYMGKRSKEKARLLSSN